MGLDNFREAKFDFSDYDEGLLNDINRRIRNEQWASNRKQRYYVVETVERTLAKSDQTKVKERRSEAQSDVNDEIPDEIAKDKQTIQKACHCRLFEGYKQPPRNHKGERQWHVLFDKLIGKIE